jgi:excisionase family DNA binding protein
MSPDNARELTLHEAAEALDVHYMTVYRYVRLGLLDARKVGKQWRVTRDALDRFTVRSESRGPESDAPWAQRLESRMIAGDANGAWSVVEAALSAGHSPADVYADYLAPALRSIGDKWQSGELAVHDEHLASSVAARLIGRLGPRFSRRGRPKGTVITAMPPGDDHGLSSAMIADIVRSVGYSVLDLGANTPVESLEATVARTDDLVAVCLSVVYDAALQDLSEMIAAVRRESPGVPVYVGGRAIPGTDAAGEFGADGWAGSLDEVGDLIEERRPPVTTG